MRWRLAKKSTSLLEPCAICTKQNWTLLILSSIAHNWESVSRDGGCDRSDQSWSWVSMCYMRQIRGLILFCRRISSNCIKISNHESFWSMSSETNIQETVHELILLRGRQPAYTAYFIRLSSILFHISRECSFDDLLQHRIPHVRKLTLDCPNGDRNCNERAFGESLSVLFIRKRSWKICLRISWHHIP